MIRIGTRSSRLALAQAEQVADGLAEHGIDTELVPTDALGDRRRSMPVHELGVAGAFTAGLERALLAEEVDLAVHSLKDLPIHQPEGLRLAAILERGRPADALLVRPEAHAEEARLPLAEGARVATSGPRRQSQLLAQREDLVVVNVRGNVDTRVAKLREGFFDALVTARVALDRLELDLANLHDLDLDPERFPPAPGQAAIAVQAREDSPAAADAAHHLDHPGTRTAVATERRLLAELGGGCGLPLGAHVRPEADAWQLQATFAGHGWDPAHRARLVREQARAEDAEGLPERVVEDLAAARPRPRRPAYERASAPAGAPVLVVASEPTARSWAAILHEAGHPAEPVPTRSFTPAEPTADAPEVAAADWIVATSPRAAEPLAELLDDTLDAYVAAVGPATARALQSQGLPCHLVAPEATGQSLAEAIASLHAGKDGRVLLAQGEIVHGDAGARLDEAGLTVDRWQAYATEEQPVDLSELEEVLPAPAALVMSGRNAQALAEADPEVVAERVLAIGPSTAEALREMGIDPLVAPAPRPDAVLEVLDR